MPSSSLQCEASSCPWASQVSSTSWASPSTRSQSLSRARLSVRSVTASAASSQWSSCAAGPIIILARQRCSWPSPWRPPKADGLMSIFDEGYSHRYSEAWLAKHRDRTAVDIQWARLLRHPRSSRAHPSAARQRHREYLLALARASSARARDEHPGSEN